MSIKHGKRRMDFALKYKNWTMEDWTRVIWSYETKINRIGQMEGCMCENKQASLYRTRNSKVWRRFLDGLGMHGPEWSGNICIDGGVNRC